MNDDQPQNEVPIHEIKIGGDHFGSFKLAMDTLLESPEGQKALGVLDQAKSVLDLGSGPGQTWLVLKNVSPLIESLDAVDIKTTPEVTMVDAMQPTRVTHHRKYINPFLQQKSENIRCGNNEFCSGSFNYFRASVSNTG